MRWPFVGIKIPPRDHALVERFVAAWRSLHPGDRSAALRALLRLGLDAAARPQNYDDRWLDVSERLSRAEALLDALGVAVSAIPALVTFLHSRADSGLDERARTVLAERLELLFEADWDHRCRTRGIPRPRFTKLPRLAPLGKPIREPAKRAWKTTVRLSRETRERVVAAALRDEITSQAALRRALDLGLRQLEVAAHHDELQRLVDAVKRIEIQLDEIGAPFAVAAPGGLGDGFKGRQGTVDQREVDVDAGFDALRGDQAAGLTGAQPFADAREHLLPMRRAHLRGDVEKRVAVVLQGLRQVARVPLDVDDAQTPALFALWAFANIPLRGLSSRGAAGAAADGGHESPCEPREGRARPEL